MGFRSTFTSEHYGIEWPEWFREKYAGTVWFNENNKGAISAKDEVKTYNGFSDLHTDIQRAIDWDDFGPWFVIVFLHECGGVTRCQIEKDVIKWTEPNSWETKEGVEHHYCYGCSDA